MKQKYFTKKNILSKFNTVSLITTPILITITILLRESGIIEYILKIFYSDVSNALCWFITLSLVAIIRLLIANVIQAIVIDLIKYFKVSFVNLIKYFEVRLVKLIKYFKSKKLSENSLKMINIISSLLFIVYFLYFYLRLFF